MMRQIAKFGLVGVVAAGTHLGVLSALVWAGLHPLLANLIAFLVAFQVSFFGHHRWTFQTHGADTQRLRVYARFFAVSLFTSFLLNEALYTLILKATWFAHHNHPTLAQVPVQLTVAIVTFVLGKYWAFRRRHP